ncbi:hypothetical protein Q5P01_023825 [Channa striata]|uniref:AIG1-type G domain-containing protein n=1 Tax=Channa striata TaxID=64152 RepID=A0AA88LR35_CHASR|nr:hypothetical protein Q5P01_023825 [Channa striata]
MECRCDKESFEDVSTGWWPNSNSIQMGTFTVVGYLLYRFSQTLPALIRWPIRLFCSLTGLSALWGWVSHLVRTFRGIQSLFKVMSRIGQFVLAFSSKCKWLVAVIKVITGTSTNEVLETDPTSSSPSKSGLRLILLGPPGGGQASLAETLLGNSESREPIGPLTESTKRRTIADGREVTVINTPDLLGCSLENNKRAREALRSLQLASPGPHVFLLVIQAPASGMQNQHDAIQAIQATLELFGVGVMKHLIPVFSHTKRRDQRGTRDQLLDEEDEGLKRIESLCGQKPELVDIRADCPTEVQSVKRRQLLERVIEMKRLRGHLVHELQRREEHMREELLR